jgi:hypothetical protein
MGYIRHEAIIVVFWDFKGALKTFNDFFDDIDIMNAQPNDDKIAVIVRPTQTTNGYYVCGILPDGSKEGWTQSDACEHQRERLAALAHGQKENGADFVYLVVADEGGPARILDSNDDKEEA